MTESGTSSTDKAKRIGAIVALVLGILADVVGITGAVAGWGGSTTKLVIGSTPAGAISTSPSAPQPKPDKAAAFVKDLDSAIRRGDAQYLFSHLHPAVIERYGEVKCRQYLATFDRGVRREVRSSPSAPGTYTYASDGRTTDVPNVVAVAVDLIARDSTQRVALHTAVVDGTYRWFTDCGTPSG